MKLFSFKGTPVYLKFPFLLLFLIIKPSMVVLLFISLLIHELAHTYVAKKLNYDVNSVVLNFFNGYAEVDLNKLTPIDTIKIVIAGPLSNLFLYILSSLIYFKFTNEYIHDLSWININLFLFNILPIFPLDGGHVLLSIFKLKTKDDIKSTKYISIVSIITAILLMVFIQSYVIVIFSLFLILLNTYLFFNKKNVSL